MIQLVKINLETGMHIEDAACECIPVLEDGAPDPQYKPQPIQGVDYMYWPKWDFEMECWTEGGTAPEPAIPEPTLEERNRADIDYLAMIMEVEL